MAQATDVTLMIVFLFCLMVLIMPSSQDNPEEPPTSTCCDECVVTKTLYKKLYKYIGNKDCGKTFASKKEAELVDCDDWRLGEKCVKYRIVYKEITPFKCVSETISKSFLTCDNECTCNTDTIW